MRSSQSDFFRASIQGHSREESDTWTKQQKQNWWKVRQDLDIRLANTLRMMEVMVLRLCDINDLSS